MMIERDPGCVVFRFFNSTSCFQVEDALQVVLKIYYQQGIANVLCDFSNTQDALGLLDLYQVIHMLSRKEFFGIRLAAYSKPNSPGIEFASMMGVKGGAKFMVFESEKTAREWLNQPQTDETSNNLNLWVRKSLVDNYYNG
jgi:hypothetical protein